MAYPGTAVPRDQWIGVLIANAERYLPVVVEAIYRNRLLYSMLRKKGRFKFNETGDQFTWLVKNKLPQPQGFSDFEEPTFQRRHRHVQATLGWKSWIATESLGWHSMQMNRGQQQLVDLGNDVLKSLTEGLKNYFASQFYENGADGASDNDLTGLEAVCGTGSATSTDKVADPSGTYAGLSKAINDAVGWTTNLSSGARPNATIATDWPLGGGAGQENYDYWSPLLVNYASTAWGNGSTAWADNCLSVLREMKAWQERRCGSQNFKIDMFMCDTGMEIDLKNKLELRGRFMFPHKEAEDLGFPETPNYEGLMVKSEYNCPVNTGYMLPIDGIAVRCVTPDLFVSEGPVWSTVQQKMNWVLKTLLNAHFESPKFMAKVANFTS